MVVTLLRVRTEGWGLKKANGICLTGTFEMPSLHACSQKHKDIKEIKRRKGI